ncbi:phenylacetic acid degradation protein [Kocuria tytonicola]|uniref:PaaI family thioesterase n=1 Tax=Kocuria tytonicola TaxID=2055946 RepID=UPI000EF95354|nr:hotdog fold thioesterase [Kocuria tytonicola]RLZ03477.1 phenylacetic acid degradation protein [Kocuria tytonicola]
MPHHPVLTGDRASEWLGVTVLRAGPGHCEISMVVREEMVNGFGIVHGGMIFSLADTCFAMTCNDPDPDGATMTVAQGVDINFLSSAQPGQTLVAEGRQIATTGRSGLCDITVTTADGELVAQFRGRSRTVPRRQKA